ncbi:MAG: tyrosine-type recombinase/integrase, partial [Bacteroidales bacterium]
YLKEKKLKPQTINIRLNSITKYYDYEKEQGTREDNPARRLRIRKEGRRIIKDIISIEQLETIYRQYSQRDKFKEEKHKFAHRRNIIILGLMIYQGINIGELLKLETKDINLEEGSIYIPSTTKSNSRTMKLQSSQIIPLHNYLSAIRKQLQPKENEFIPGDVYNIISWLIKDLQHIAPQIKNTYHIRASVIMYWLKHNKIRQVQYMAGHKHISSTEKYREEDLEGLQKQLNKYHPFN